jgi:hypothetical protein
LETGVDHQRPPFGDCRGLRRAYTGQRKQLILLQEQESDQQSLIAQQAELLVTPTACAGSRPPGAI